MYKVIAFLGARWQFVKCILYIYYAKYAYVMNSTKLKHIVAVDQHESISAAAKSLNLTQSTVSRSVADIEHEIGYALFDRRARDVVATERGAPVH